MAQVVPERTRWGLIALIWLAGLCAAGQFAKVAVPFESFRAVWPGAGAVLGLVVSVVGFVGILFGTSAGIAVARIGARRMMIGALAAGAVLSAVQAVLPPIWPMIGLRGLEGFAHLAIVVSGPVLIAQVSQPRHLAATMTLWSTFFGVTFAIFAWAGLPLVAAWGPGALIAVHAGAMAVMAVVLALVLPAAPPRPAGALRLGQILADHRRIYASPRIAAPAMGFIFYTAMFVAMLTLMPGLVDPEWRTLVAALMPLVSILVSLGLGVAAVRRWGAVRVVQGGLALAALAALAWAIEGGAGGLGVAVALLMSAALGLMQGASFAAIPELNDTGQTRAEAAGAIAQLGNVGTTLGTPALLILIDRFGPVAVTWYALPLCAAGIAVHSWNRWRRLNA